MSAGEVREKVEAALAAADIELGTYHLPGGETTPALWVGNPPEGTTAEGLEVQINPNPKQVSIDAFTFVGMPRAYLVRLANWDDLPDILKDATNAIAQALWPFEDEPRLVPALPPTPELVLFSVQY